MPTSFSYIVIRLFTFPLLLLQLLQNCYLYFCHCYIYYHTTLLLNTLLQILSYLGVVELTTQLLILKNILWLPLCRINKLGLNTLPSKAVVIPYTCGLSVNISMLIISTIWFMFDLSISNVSRPCLYMLGSSSLTRVFRMCNRLYVNVELITPDHHVVSRHDELSQWCILREKTYTLKFSEGSSYMLPPY